MNLDFWVTLLQFVGALVTLIIVHELGHFIVARLLGVEVEEFGIGFPPRITTLFEAWGTKFTLNAIPFGGFVRPKGENDPSIEGGLAAANPWVRIAVLIAGPIANLTLAVLLYTTILSQTGIPDYNRVEILSVLPNTPADTAQLQDGDVVVSADGQPINGVEDLHNYVYSHLGVPVTLTYQRGDQFFETTLTPRENPPAGEGSIGIVMTNPAREANWFEALPYGAQSTYRLGTFILSVPVQMIRGDSNPDQGRFVGFKGMFDIYQEVRDVDAEAPVESPIGLNALFFFTQLSLSLGMFNLFPFPALDGGRIMFALPEIVLGRRMPPEAENWINLVGFGLLLILLLYINLQDFLSPVSIP